MAIWFQGSYMCIINSTNCCRKFIHACHIRLASTVRDTVA
ncbi:unnamed protein product [Acanthoscelides obtectus]|uniref:Uncharacterized protein n=1 Tax=Acanthoscelides obtectus TaxID=200917 RepID=A0A9P0JT07_ACAOB|nr:unnamed protein product [Acanthoscelides obtectus]CAK1627935.1 hypothetical protein AOBTE_LOCUS4921 [Acanthoscelides obtectus]